MPLHSSLRTVFAFAALGPCVGAVTVMIGTWAYTLVMESRSLRFHWYEVGVITAWAYALAVVPAAVNGLIWSIVVRSLNPKQAASYSFRALLGLLLGGVVATFAGLIWDMAGWSQLYVWMSPAGAAAGGLLAPAFPRTRRLLDSEFTVR